jgi:hypothetical protein
MIRADLVVSASTLNTIVESGKWPPGAHFPVDNWRTHGAQLALSLDDPKAWNEVEGVVDSEAFGRLYASPLSLQRFEVDAGLTNRSNYRLEGHATFGVERVTAGVRII